MKFRKGFSIICLSLLFMGIINIPPIASADCSVGGWKQVNDGFVNGDTNIFRESFDKEVDCVGGDFYKNKKDTKSYVCRVTAIQKSTGKKRIRTTILTENMTHTHTTIHMSREGWALEDTLVFLEYKDYDMHKYDKDIVDVDHNEGWQVTGDEIVNADIELSERWFNNNIATVTVTFTKNHSILDKKNYMCVILVENTKTKEIIVKLSEAGPRFDIHPANVYVPSDWERSDTRVETFYRDWDWKHPEGLD